MGLSENLVEIKSEVDALTTYANETTGASDETLSDAVASLVAGYGGGGSGVQTASGTISLASSVYSFPQINHNLGVSPRLVVIKHTEIQNQGFTEFCGMFYIDGYGLPFYTGSGMNNLDVANSSAPFFTSTYGSVTNGENIYKLSQTSRKWAAGTYNWNVYYW